MIQGIASLVQDGSQAGPRLAAWASALHLLGGLVGGAACSATAWLILTAPRTLLPFPARVGVLFFAGISLSASDIGWRHRKIELGQVPPEWTRRYGVPQAFLMYGAALGAGVATHVEYGITYMAFATASLLIPLPWALLGGAMFGLGRTWAVGPLGFLGGAGGRFPHLAMSSVSGTLAKTSAVLTLLVPFFVCFLVATTH
jgi:hypothetical protein